MLPRYQVKLSKEERGKLEAMTRRGKTQARRFIHARALLLCDAGAGGPAWNVADVATAVGVTRRTIAKIKKRFVENGLEAAIERMKREKPPRGVFFGEAFETRLIALACSDPPEGHRRWTLRLLAEKAVELRFAESVSHMSVQRILKKAHLSLTSANNRRSRPNGVKIWCN